MESAVWTVKKLHLNGSLVWSHTLTSALKHMYIIASEQNETEEIFLTATDENWPILAGGDGAINTLLYKYDAAGELLWTLTQPTYDSSWILPLISPTQDGGCLHSIMVVGQMFNQSIIQKISASGVVLWSDTTHNATGEARENSQGDIFVNMWRYEGLQSTHPELQKRTASGQLVWSKNNTVVIALAANGDFLSTSAEGPPTQSAFIRYDTDGNLLWKKRYPFFTEGMYIVGSTATPDNGFILAIEDWPRLLILKMDANGNIYPVSITGQMVLDDNVNCLIDSSEQALANWKVELISPSLSLYATTDSTGHYEMSDIPGGDYLLSAVAPSSLWESCAGELPFAIPDTGALAIQQDLPLQVVADCPFMTLDIGTARLRRCFPGTYTVHYCNDGTVAADSVYVQIVLDPLLHFNSASLPHTQQGDTLYFSLGAVASLECGDFTFQATVDCDSAELDQTLCVAASIFPDSICQPPANWSGALLEGSGRCDGDSIRFQVQNIGLTSSSAGLDFIVLDDHVIMLQQPLPTLSPNGIHKLAVPADGSTWRLIADQEPNAPGLEMPSVGVEGCGTGFPPTWGFQLQFANRDGNPFTDQDCHEVIGAYDPNDKQGFPTGIHAEHLIEQNIPLDYQIRFQNTGTDTAFTVVVRDTLSPWLNAATLRAGAASHPYTWTLSGAGILTFTFDNILLPDSNVNEAASHGFIQFSIDQQKDLQSGTFLENRAGIYFDFNPVVLTNTVHHTIGHEFLPSTAREPAAALPVLEFWPNPAGQVTSMWAEKPFRAGQRLVLRTALGQVVREIMVTGQSVDIRRAGLPAGLYFAELRAGNQVLAVGKVVWE